MQELNLLLVFTSHLCKLLDVFRDVGQGGFSRGVICSQPPLEAEFTIPGLGITLWKS